MHNLTGVESFPYHWTRTSEGTVRPNAQRSAEIRERINKIRQELDSLLTELGAQDEPPPNCRRLRAVAAAGILLAA